MKTSTDGQTALRSRDRILEDLIAEITDHLQAGERVDLSAILADHPEHAEILRNILPAIEVMAEFGRSSAAGRPADQAASALVPAALGVLGDFRIICEVGRGGMGVVYEAEQLSLRRRVALKVLPYVAAVDPKQLQRFRIEAQAAAQLHHTNIVPVHAVGCERGVHYYAMQFIEGQTLADVIKELRQLAGLDAVDPSCVTNVPPELAANLATGTWYGSTVKASETAEPASSTATPRPLSSLAASASTRDRAYFWTIAQLGIQAAEALDYAHGMGLVHRDIKPANLLLDVRGNLWIADFGLARMANDASLTVTGDLVGTIRYMSPEQALAKRVVVDHRTDIYSLGVTLYELLGLRPAFDGDRQDVLRQIAFAEPGSLRSVNRAVPIELDTIVMKAMSKDPSSRYSTAQEFADDLQRFLDQKPIRAKRPSLARRAAQWTRRHTAVVATALILLTLGTAISTWQAVRAMGAAREARAEADRAAAINDFLVNDLLKQTEPHRNPLATRVTLREVLDRAALSVGNRFRAQPLLEAALRSTIGEAYHELGVLDKCRDHWAAALAIYEGQKGPFAPETANAQVQLGHALHDFAQYADGERLIRQAVATLERTRGREHPDTLHAIDNLASVCRDRNKATEAETLFRRVVQVRTRLLGLEHLETLQATNHLAMVYQSENRPAQAKELFTRILEIRRRVQGKEHPQTLEAMNNLANLLAQGEGKPAEAEPLLAEMVQAARRTLGEEFWQTLEYEEGLATVCDQLGKLDQAEALLAKVLKIRRRVLGEESPETLGAAHGLGTLLLRQGKLADAETVLVGAVKGWGAAPGEHDRDKELSLHYLGQVYHSQGRFSEAKRVFTEQVELVSRLRGPDDGATLMSMTHLAAVHRALGELEEAVSVQTRVVDCFRRTHGENDSNTLLTMGTLGDFYRIQGKLAQAEQLLARVLAANERLFGERSPSTLNCLDKIAQVYLDMRRFGEAERFARRCLALRKQVAPDEYLRFHTESLLGGALVGQKNCTEAERLLLSAYAGLSDRISLIPAQHKDRLQEAGQRIVELYEAWGQPEKSDAWRAKLGLARSAR
jgi:serine/threonine protein kinase/tetratricopeptide (TPR) repeat protein